MRKILILFLMFALIAGFASAKVEQDPKCTGSVWTTDVDGNVQDQNQYAIGEQVYVKAQSLLTSTVLNYDIIDVGHGNNVVFSGTITTDSDGDVDVPQFVFDTTSADSGVYKVEVDCIGNKKSDNFKVVDDSTNEVPEFGVVAAGVAMIGALGIFAFTRRH